ncbi:MAG: hypothetical protein IRY99_28065 [Isosphaeraceae bacterium]|nr:hypothetical protein [Isosphaeraceae bacterium]
MALKLGQALLMVLIAWVLMTLPPPSPSEEVVDRPRPGDSARQDSRDPRHRLQLGTPIPPGDLSLPIGDAYEGDDEEEWTGAAVAELRRQRAEEASSPASSQQVLCDKGRLLFVLHLRC